MSTTEVWTAEQTDTFGGIANYSYVNKVKFVVPKGASQRTIVKRGKAAIGWTGLRCTTEDCGTWITVKPSGLCQILFLYFDHVQHES